MIYLICLQDEEKCFIPINSKSYLTSNFFHFFLTLTKNKNVLFSYSFFKLINRTFPNRNNIIFFNKFKKQKIPSIPNGILTSNINDIITYCHNKQQDIYIFVSNQNFCNLFAPYDDYLIIYETADEKNIKYLTPSIDIIKFNEYNFLTKTIDKNATIYYFAKNDHIY